MTQSLHLCFLFPFPPSRIAKYHCPTPGAVETSFRGERQLCRGSRRKGQVPGPCRFLDQEPHRHDEALPDHRFAGPTQCLDHDSEARVLSHPFATDAKVGKMYSNFVEEQEEKPILC